MFSFLVGKALFTEKGTRPIYGLDSLFLSIRLLLSYLCNRNAYQSFFPTRPRVAVKKL